MAVLTSIGSLYSARLHTRIDGGVTNKFHLVENTPRGCYVVLDYEVLVDHEYLQIIEYV